MTKQFLIKTATLFATVFTVAAHAETVVIVHPKNPASSMTAAEVAQVYLGKSSALKPMDLPESSPIRDTFYHKVTEKDGSQVKAIWARLIFTGKATPPKEMGTSEAVAKAVAADEKAIGYADKSAIDGSVKVILSVP